MQLSASRSCLTTKLSITSLNWYLRKLRFLRIKTCQVQVLKHENYHSGPLAVFLVKRALKNRILVGHNFFWYLMVEVSNQQSIFMKTRTIKLRNFSRGLYFFRLLFAS